MPLKTSERFRCPECNLAVTVGRVIVSNDGKVERARIFEPEGNLTCPRCFKGRNTLVFLNREICNF